MLILLLTFIKWFDLKMKNKDYRPIFKCPLCEHLLHISFFQTVKSEILTLSIFSHIEILYQNIRKGLGFFRKKAFYTLFIVPI